MALKILQQEVLDIESVQEDTKSNIKQSKAIIEALKGQRKDEYAASLRVNHYLNNYFGHEHLSLQAIKGESGYRFEVIRNNKKAHHLSEGECSLVAFCYFMAKLEDIETKNNNPIIWIDDPISSLDGNHIFFVFSLIGNEIVKNLNFKQLFISTHNLDFLKYLKRLPPVKNSNEKDLERRYFVFERADHQSQIKAMPKYLKQYVTEFNYLFHQIYKCAKADISSEIDHDCFYNYGNNARKFLEAFLYYKYPNANENDKTKLARFFDNPISELLIERTNNEYSHLEEVFDRSINPIDVPEMKKQAQFILNKIQANDKDQYNALLESISIKINNKLG